MPKLLDSQDEMAGEAGPAGDGRWVVLKELLYELLCKGARDLRDESVELHSNMETALARLKWKGLAADLSDIRTGNWYKTKTEMQILQKIYVAMQRLERGEDVGALDNDNLFVGEPEPEPGS